MPVKQVEYAIEAIKLGSTAIGIQTADGVVVAVEKRITSTLMEPHTIEKIVEVSIIEGQLSGYYFMQRDGIYTVGILEHFLSKSKQTPKPLISKESQDVVCFEKIKTQLGQANLRPQISTNDACSIFSGQNVFSIAVKYERFQLFQIALRLKCKNVNS